MQIFCSTTTPNSCPNFVKTTAAPNDLFMQNFYNLFELLQVLKQFAEAVMEYEEVLQLSQDYIPALKG